MPDEVVKKPAKGAGLRLLPGGAAAAEQASQQAAQDSTTASASAAQPSPSKYSEAEFLMGHGSKWRPTEQVYARIDTGYVSEARRWVEHMQGHYKTLGDLIVHAVVRHLHWLTSIEGELVGSILNELDQMGEVCAKEEFELRYVKLIDRIGTVIADTLELPGGKIEVAHFLRRIRARIDRMKPSFHKTHFVKMYFDRFAAYEHAGVLALTGGEEEGGSIGLPDEVLQMLQEADEADAEAQENDDAEE